ncbi:MAG: alpha-glucan family phosphorylase [Fimbriimonas sp.]
MSSIATAHPTLPRVPERLAGLVTLAYNLAYAWLPGTLELFGGIEPQNPDGPVAALRSAENLDSLAGDEAFVAEVNAAVARLERYLANNGPHASFPGLVAYFCAEFGLHETFPVYSGGLGILAGDHCKEASDQGLPFVAVGLFYRRGFFRQMVDGTGRQEHEFLRLPPEDYPVERVLSADGLPFTLAVELPGRDVHVAVWRVRVGRIDLVMLDTDLPENTPQDRPITSQLYTSGRDMRLHQEIILGVGGVRALRALGIEPTVWHLNEGHSAFLLLERLRRGESAAAIKASSILTIHTPVAAGNERFDAEHTLRTLSAILATSPVGGAELLALGVDSEGTAGTFDLTAFAIRHTRAANGVSLLHGRTADGTWGATAGHAVTGLTNGVHMPTWLGPELRAATEGAGASFEPSTQMTLRERGELRADWPGIDQVSDEDLWRAHLAQKQRLLEFARRKLVAQHARHGAGPDELATLNRALDPEAFTIGFARRFATYKRAALLFSNERRLLKLLNSVKRPVQIIFAGKAHPADREGQELIAKVYAKTQSPRLRGKVFLLEEYNMETGRMLVQGADIWLNNPRRPLEASGTSGMKAAANGVPNVSILDGWWDEAYEADWNGAPNGWAIGDREIDPDTRKQDKKDAESLYHLLESEVIPAFFDRDAAGIPRRWLQVMRASIATSLHAFATKRMIDDYVSEMYSG